MDPRNLLLIEPLQQIIPPIPPQPDERRSSRGDEEGGEKDDECETDTDDYEEDGTDEADDEAGEEGEDYEGDCHDDEEAEREAGEGDLGGDEGLQKGRWLGCLCCDLWGVGKRTASAGFSVANLDILAISSLRFSGGKILSSQAEPLLSMPPTVPWRAPVAPLITSAMVVVFGEEGASICGAAGGGPVRERLYGKDVCGVDFELGMWRDAGC